MREKAIGSQGGSLDVWPENWDAMCLFVACDTQWARVSLSDGQSVRLVRVGLNYSAVESAARMMGFKKKERKPLFEKMQILERESLRLFGKS